MTRSSIPGKIPKTKKKKKKISFSIRRVCKPADQSCSNSISRVPLKLSSAYVFNFRLTLKIKDSLHKKQANKLSDKIKGSSHKKKKCISQFLKNGFNDSRQIL